MAHGLELRAAVLASGLGDVLQHVNRIEDLNGIRAIIDDELAPAIQEADRLLDAIYNPRKSARPVRAATPVRHKKDKGR